MLDGDGDHEVDGVEEELPFLEVECLCAIYHFGKCAVKLQLQLPLLHFQLSLVHRALVDADVGRTEEVVQFVGSLVDLLLKDLDYREL
jgi:hypothetical protein